jgi:hypothetical protein
MTFLCFSILCGLVFDAVSSVTVWCWVVGRFMSDELEGIWKEAVVSLFELCISWVQVKAVSFHLMLGLCVINHIRSCYLLRDGFLLFLSSALKIDAKCSSETLGSHRTPQFTTTLKWVFSVRYVFISHCLVTASNAVDPSNSVFMSSLAVAYLSSYRTEQTAFQLLNSQSTIDTLLSLGSDLIENVSPNSFIVASYDYLSDRVENVICILFTAVT